MNQRTVFSIANEVAVDLLGHREMHACRASMPVVAPSRVPVHLDGNVRGINKESTPPSLFFVKDFSKHGSVGVCRHAAFDSARVHRVAGYFRCIGTGPMHVFLYSRKSAIQTDEDGWAPGPSTHTDLITVGRGPVPRRVSYC